MDWSRVIFMKITPKPMKKSILSSAIFFFFYINVSAQDYQPFPTDEAIWEVTRCWYFYEPGWYDSYTFSMDGSDTLYNGELYKKIYITNHHLPGTVHDTIYPVEFFGGMREANKQIFIYQHWASVDTSVMLVYDFNQTNVGDTIYTNVLSGNPNLFGHLVTAADSVLVGTTYHKRIHLEDINNSYNTEYWIEGVGSSWGLPFATFWSITDNSYDLSCFYEKQDLKYENPSPTYGYCQAPPTITCEIISSVKATSEYDENWFEIYPNPASDELTLALWNNELPSAKIKIYNTSGILLRSHSLNQVKTQLGISDLPNGVYFIVLNRGEKVVSKKLIVQR